MLLKVTITPAGREHYLAQKSKLYNVILLFDIIHTPGFILFILSLCYITMICTQLSITIFFTLFNYI